MTTPRIELEEWETRDVSGLQLSQEDCAVLEALAGKGRIELDYLATGVRLRAKHWVGTIQLSGCSLRILPKAAGSNLNVLRMAGYATGLASLDRIGSASRELDHGEDLLELLILLMSESAEQVVRRGLHSDYVEAEEDLRFVRGRILVSPYVRSRASKPSTVPCRHDEHTSNVEENRLLAAALAVGHRIATSDGVRRNIGPTLQAYEEACDGSVQVSEATNLRPSYNRLNEHYRSAHSLARLLLDGFAVSELEGNRSVQSYAFLIDMNTLFERFLLRVLEDLAKHTGAAIRYQERDRSVITDMHAGKPFSSIRPDYLLTFKGSQKLLAIDAKYKYRVDGPAETDVYQAFLYAIALSNPRATLIIHPRISNDVKDEHLRIRRGQTQLADVHTHAIEISRALDEVTREEYGPESRALIEAVNRATE